MRFLFVVADFPTLGKANVEIAYKIKNELEKMGHTVFVYGKFEKHDEYDIELSPLGKQYIIDLISNKDLSPYIKQKRLFNIGKKYKGFNYVYNEMLNSIPNIVKDYKIDCIIPFSIPHKLNEVLKYRKRVNIPICLFMLDPYSSHYTKKKYRFLFEIKEFLVCRKADRIFTTKLIKEEYLKSKILRFLRKKIIITEFPLINKKVFKISKSNKKIKIGYFGTLYSDIRNPVEIVDALSRLKPYDFEIDFYTLLYGFPHDFKETFEEKYPFVHMYDMVDNSIVDNIINDYDILLNLGNQIMNQMPSKILDYINTGKPILNIVYSFECPTIDYLINYPLSLTFQKDDINELQLRKFLDSSRAKLIEKSKILDLFNHCTSEYVAMNILREVGRYYNG